MRVFVVFVAGLFLAVSVVGSAAASSASPATGIAVEYDRNVSTLRDSADAADCPDAGQRVKLSTSPEVYLVDPEFELNLIPNATVYENLFRTWNGILTYDNLFTECYGLYFTLNDAHLAKTSSGPEVYIYQEAVNGYRWIVNGAIFDKYNFSWEKVREQPTVEPIRTVFPWNF